MNPSSSELKSIAKGKLIGNYPICIGIFVITMLISFCATFLLSILYRPSSTFSTIIYFLTSTIISLILSIFSAGTNYFYLKLCRGQELSVSHLFFSFRNCPDRILIIMFLVFVIELVCMLPMMMGFVFMALAPDSVLVLLVLALTILISAVISIMVLLNYSLVFFIYADAPHKSSLAIMRESKEMMKGNKGRYFYLSISFIGLAILSIFTCYIGLLWLTPYMNTTFCEFYLNLKATQAPSPTISQAPEW